MGMCSSKLASCFQWISSKFEPYEERTNTASTSLPSSSSSSRLDPYKDLPIQERTNTTSTSLPSSSSSSASPSKLKWTYDVFLSFRGEDTRNNFADHLYMNLKQKRINTFRDEEKLERGREISGDLLKAIEESRFAIIIFSENYASSSWCLDELVKIIDCKRETGQIAYPVFYNVDPSNVRKQEGSFDVYKKKNLALEKMEKWGDALTQAGSISGWDTRNKFEAKIIQEIVDEIFSKLDPGLLRVNDNLVEERPSEPTLGLEFMFDEVWSYMIGDQQALIGLYGMGGVGKTTLLTKLNNQLRNSNTQSRFDVVIWIVVSKTKNYKKVQDDIGRKIGFHDGEWRNKSQEDKAVDILRVLSKKKFVLFLDDIWDRFNLTEVGVPYLIQSSMSKVVFTTRSKDVCGQMGAHKKVEVKCLTEEAALNLFKEKVGGDTLNSHPKIPELAEVVAKKCDGLPLALITIGRAMACKTTPQEWLHAIQVLKHPASNLLGMADEVFPLLKFSYDSLQSSSVQPCFLYCSLYPEDCNIYKEELIDRWICEGFLDELNDFYATRNLAHSIIGTLVRASLLEEVSDKKVKMHDVIRDMALWIGGECGAMKDKFFVQAGVGLTETPMNVKWEVVERMSLVENKIVELTGTPKCPNLLTLFLNNNKLEIITGAFFQSMPSLRVLELSRNGISRLPKEICELVSLQYLNLSWVGLKELPIEFKNLVNLKYLTLNSLKCLLIPEGIVANLIKLQGLCMFQCDVGETLVKELESLKYLSRLSITIKSASQLSQFVCSPKLPIITKRLELTCFNESKYRDVSFLQNTTSLKLLSIHDCEELEELIIELEGTEVIPKIISHFDCYFLNFAAIRCPKLKDLTWLTFAPNLIEIRVWDCSGMEAIIGEWKWGDAGGGGTTQCCLFSKLETLYLNDLPNLESIYSNALPFPCLKQVGIRDCPKLKRLPFDSNTAKGFVIKASEEWWNRLEWEDEATKECFSSSLHELPKGKAILELH